MACDYHSVYTCVQLVPILVIIRRIKWSRVLVPIASSRSRRRHRWPVKYSHAQQHRPSLQPSSSNYVLLTSSSLRPITNYSLVIGPQIPSTYQYLVQSTTQTTRSQYLKTGNVRHILPSSSEPTNITCIYMLPSGAHIVRINIVTTNTVLTSSAHKENPSIM